MINTFPKDILNCIKECVLSIFLQRYNYTVLIEHKC